MCCNTEVCHALTLPSHCLNMSTVNIVDALFLSNGYTLRLCQSLHFVTRLDRNSYDFDHRYHCCFCDCYYLSFGIISSPKMPLPLRFESLPLTFFFLPLPFFSLPHLIYTSSFLISISPVAFFSLSFPFLPLPLPFLSLPLLVHVPVHSRAARKSG
jgi:hypothetical protein